MNSLEGLIAEALVQPAAAIAYFAGRRLREIFPARHVLECSACGFDLDGFIEAGHATLSLPAVPAHHQVMVSREGCGPDALGAFFEMDEARGRVTCASAMLRRARNAWMHLAWQGRELDVLRLTWAESMGERMVHLVVAEGRELAEAFFRAVSDWSAMPHGEVLVYERGGWQKDRALYESIRKSTFESLVLAPGLKESLRADVEGFFAHRDIYQRHRVPWKRGILLIGPPGNGKTHAVKALCHGAGVPALYVRSLEPAGRYFGSEHANIAQVFDLARATAPCLLVLEDLDALLKPENRSVMLNQLDGFSENTGLCVVGTTNFPERLDPSILDRPSRFDRKYFFDLPAFDERVAFLRHWNEGQTVELRLSGDGLSAVAVATEGFSFAYLKELCLSMIMAWINARQERTMDQVGLEQSQLLARQMQSAPGARSEESASAASGSMSEIERVLRASEG